MNYIDNRHCASSEPKKVVINLTVELRRMIAWMTNPSTSQKVPKYVQEGMDQLKRQVKEQSDE